MILEEKDYYWFVVTGQYDKQDLDTMKVKTVKSQVIVRAINLADLESSALPYFELLTTSPSSAKITGVKQVEIEKILFNGLTIDNGEVGNSTEITLEDPETMALFRTKVNFYALDEKSGKLKKASSSDYWVPAVTAVESSEIVSKHLADCTVDWKIDSVSMSKIESILVDNDYLMSIQNDLQA